MEHGAHKGYVAPDTNCELSNNSSIIIADI